MNARDCTGSVLVIVVMVLGQTGETSSNYCYYFGFGCKQAVKPVPTNRQILAVKPSLTKM